MIRSLAYLSIFLVSASVQGQGLTYDLGRPATTEEIQVWDFAIRPDGNELPVGSGTADEGAQLYAMKCAGCHGPQGQGAIAPEIVGRRSVLNYWPFATSVWDYINRAMPLFQEGSLTYDEVYAITAYLFERSSIISADLELTDENLADVEMPNRDGYEDPPISQWEPGMRRIFEIIDP
jgi:cytochrome c